MRVRLISVVNHSNLRHDGKIIAMSNLRLNVRILMWHIQVAYNWRISVTYNDFHKGLKYGWFAVYQYRRFFESPKTFDRENAA